MTVYYDEKLLIEQGGVIGVAVCVVCLCHHLTWTLEHKAYYLT